MTARIVAAPRRPWVRPRITALAADRAENGLVGINPEGLGKGS